MHMNISNRLCHTTITNATGVRLQVAVTGSVGGAGQVPLLLLHGLADTWYSYAGILARLPIGIAAVAPTLRGNGDSGRPSNGYRPDELAADMVDILDGLGIERVVVVGHSLGAAIACRLASKAPERVAGLVLIGACATSTRNIAVVDLLDFVGRVEDSIDRDPAGEFPVGTIAGCVDAIFVGGVVAECTKVPAWVWRAASAGSAAVDPFANSSIHSVPTLLLWRDREALVTREEQDRIVQVLSDAALHVFRRKTHAVSWQPPTPVASEHIEFHRARA